MSYRRSYRKRGPAAYRKPKPYQKIEYPSRGATYFSEEYGVYEYGTYEGYSVLAGQQKRTFKDSFATLEEAQAAYPDATYDGDGATHRVAPNLSHLPDDEDY